MNALLLQPTDVLFFRDGRPMSGSLPGHGAAWPLPTVTNAVLHAALHRAGLEGVHGHDHRSGERAITDARRFGSLLTAGPFPVCPEGDWFFPRPLDTGVEPDRPHLIRHLPLGPHYDTTLSSLPAPLRFPVLHTGEPSKATPAPWWNRAAWDAYLNGTSTVPEGARTVTDSDFSDTEHQIGIGIDPNSQTQDEDRFYSAQYLRLRQERDREHGWRLGLLAEAMDKIDGDPANLRDLMPELFPNSGAETPVIVGGQQRVCTVQRKELARLPLPVAPEIEGTRVKWVLLSPAIFPAIAEGTNTAGQSIHPHPGGWVPTWIDPGSGKVLLKSGNTARWKENGRLVSRRKWRERIRGMEPVRARLVAALTGKPVAVTGYGLSHKEIGKAGAPKPTYLAVPAGSVYYFEAEGADEGEKQANARKLAHALNWHGATEGAGILHRRSTLMGEKGFGLGVCAPWNFADF